MTTRRNPLDYSCFSPFVLWGSLAAQTAEMMLASAQVIGHRTRRMALAGVAPSARDRREFALMAQEKVHAGSRSVQAMTSHVLKGNQLLYAQAFANMLQTTSALVMLASSRTPAQWIARQKALGRTLGSSRAGIADVQKSATRLAHRGLKPFHAKATANAKRLVGRS